ncbi:MAG: nucleotide exchange factor GrpE [Elusimicrobiota bacterium]
MNNKKDLQEKKEDQPDDKKVSSEDACVQVQEAGKEEKAETDAMTEKIKAHEEEIKELKEKLLYRMAEFDNYRKRTLQENQRFIETANQDLLQEFIPLFDSLNRAIKQENRNSPAELLFEGLKLIHSQLFDIIKKQGVTVMDCLGKEFNPVYHDALMQCCSEKYKDGVIMQVAEEGYMYKDNVLRPAKVIVSKGKEKSCDDIKREEEKKSEIKVSSENKSNNENKAEKGGCYEQGHRH